MKSKKSHISEKDFSRYLNNQMTDNERNAFERELQKHPFEAEALEGFQQISPEELNNDLSELKTKITQKKKHSKTRIWAAAATFLLLVSAGVIWFQVKDKSPIPQMAETKTIQNEKTEIEQEKIINPQIQSETEDQPEKTAEDLPIEKNTPNQEIITKQETQTENSDNQTIKANDEKEYILSDSEIEEENQIIDVQPKLANEDIKNAEKPINLMPQTNNVQSVNLNINIDDSLNKLQFEKGISRAASPQISMKKNAEIPTNKKAEPKTGFDEFEKYLKKEAIFPKNYKSQNDTVKMVLKIDPEGKITEILNTNPADSILFVRSKEIIRNGPEWNPEIKNGKNVESETELILIFRKQD